FCVDSSLCTCGHQNSAKGYRGNTNQRNWLRGELVQTVEVGCSCSRTLEPDARGDNLYLDGSRSCAVVLGCSVIAVLADFHYSILWPAADSKTAWPFSFADLRAASGFLACDRRNETSHIFLSCTSSLLLPCLSRLSWATGQ